MNAPQNHRFKAMFFSFVAPPAARSWSRESQPMARSDEAAFSPKQVQGESQRTKSFHSSHQVLNELAVLIPHGELEVFL